MMANDSFIPDFGDDQQQALEDMELYYHEQQEQYQCYLNALINDEGSSVTLNDRIKLGEIAWH